MSQNAGKPSNFYDACKDTSKILFRLRKLQKTQRLNFLSICHIFQYLTFLNQDTFTEEDVLFLEKCIKFKLV